MKARCIYSKGVKGLQVGKMYNFEQKVNKPSISIDGLNTPYLNIIQESNIVVYLASRFEIISSETNFYTDKRVLRESALSYPPLEYRRISEYKKCPLCQIFHQEITVKDIKSNKLIEILKYDCTTNK